MAGHLGAQLDCHVLDLVFPQPEDRRDGQLNRVVCFGLTSDDDLTAGRFQRQKS